MPRPAEGLAFCPRLPTSCGHDRHGRAPPQARNTGGFSPASRLFRPVRARGVADRHSRRRRRGAAIHAGDAAHGQGVLGAHVELRSARLGGGSRRLPLSADPPGDGAALAGDSGERAGRVARPLPRRPGAGSLPHQLLRRGRAHGTASGSRRSPLRRAGAVDLAGGNGRVSPRRPHAAGADAQFPPRVGGCGRAGGARPGSPITAWIARSPAVRPW